MKEHQPTLVADDFVFLEAPRWRDHQLWVSDVFDQKVYTISEDGTRRKVCDVPHRPAGLGFLPDGTPIIASMKDRKLMKLVEGTLLPHADLSDFAAGDLNDFVVDEFGRIYVGNFGYDLHGGAPMAATDLHLVDVDGSIRVAASSLEFPNGTVLIDAGRTLVVAETWSCRLTAFDRSTDGTLANRRIHADLGHCQPDGICVDSLGGIWVSSFNTGEFLRVLEGGEITDRIAFDGSAVACQLGGEDGATLYCCTCTATIEETLRRERRAAVYQVRVDVPSP